MIQLLLAAAILAGPQTPAVTIDQFRFAPATITVKAGQTVRFINKDQEAHTVTSRSGTFNSGGLDTNGSWTFVFTKPGKYPYFCELHPYMTGTVIVR